MLEKLVNPSHAGQLVGAQQWAARISLAVGVGVGYFLTAKLGFSLLTATEHVAVYWPASGIAVGILIAFGRSACAPVAMGVIVASAAAALHGNWNVWTALAIGFCNAGEALLVMWLIERWFGTAFNLDSVRRVLGFFAAAALAPAIAAVGASVAIQHFSPSTAGFLDIWKVWFASDALGIIAVAPLVIGVVAAVRDPPSWRELLEGSSRSRCRGRSEQSCVGLSRWTLVADDAGLVPLPIVALGKLPLPPRIRSGGRILYCRDHRVDDDPRIRPVRRPDPGDL